MSARARQMSARASSGCGYGRLDVVSIGKHMRCACAIAAVYSNNVYQAVFRLRKKWTGNKFIAVLHTLSKPYLSLIYLLGGRD